MEKLAKIKAYHEQTKHRLDKYANGPETIDWDAQPSHFRYFEDCEIIPLPLGAKDLPTRYQALWHVAEIPAQPLSGHALGAFLELALGLSAWKVYGTAKWSLRCNPSSGNLHPTEAYLLLPELNDLKQGLFHYCPEKHGLEQRAHLPGQTFTNTGHFYIALSSVAWREAWKYGERAFRYCQLDTGHALMAIQIAAACLGWRAKVSTQLSLEQLASLTGVNRDQDFFEDEREHAEVLIRIDTKEDYSAPDLASLRPEFLGRANRLDHHHFYKWPLIEDAFEASTDALLIEDRPIETGGRRLLLPDGELSAADIIKQRRSATDFNPSAEMSQSQFYTLLTALVPASTDDPWSLYSRTDVSLVFYVHRVEGLKRGLYALLRNPAHREFFKQHMRDTFTWEGVENAPDELPFYALLNANAQGAARTLSCHQAIASNSAFSISMIAEYKSPLAKSTAMYRQLHWEAGMIGQILYLEAEAINLRGTGIGCFFDDTVHETLGICDDSLQVLYHFTVGEPVIDHRITSLPAYTDR